MSNKPVYYQFLFVLAVLFSFIVSVVVAGRWVWRVWPRYEIQEKVIVSFYGLYDRSGCKEEDKNILYCFCQDDGMVDGDNMWSKFSWEWEWKESCYIKERVKIN